MAVDLNLLGICGSLEHDIKEFEVTVNAGNGSQSIEYFFSFIDENLYDFALKMRRTT